MSDTVKALVDRGFEIRSQMKKLKTELESIEKKLTQIGLNSDHVELKDGDREGRRWLAHGSTKILPVVFTADKLIQSFQKNSPIHQNIELIAGQRMLEFFKPVEAFKNQFDNGKKFRDRADAVLGERAPAFITACLARDKNGIPKSDIKILWEDAEEIV